MSLPFREGGKSSQHIGCRQQQFLQRCINVFVVDKILSLKSAIALISPSLVLTSTCDPTHKGEQLCSLSVATADEVGEILAIIPTKTSAENYIHTTYLMKACSKVILEP